ncbi:MAG: hypothetical protein PUB46_10365 [Lachnospiraceae bacterium]|uniref:hypothetical protein n=1 Tax=Roseburia hominis TaxID=301301 RepID=UPI001F1CCE4C|nr:hypothetical protein [Roseburia hominis]MCI5712146.1 hypothetical protein [Lachnospiraceae bacterium]MDD6170450.1 hypothetical protein [Lachnospiraceae bacterium]MDY4838717.1 hypothetical protein [Lachnospiraceae bacterium]
MDCLGDIELCKIADVKVKEKVMFLLIRNRVPYAERWDEVPFLKRAKYHGAKEVCVILTHPEHKDEAVKMIHTLDKEIQSQIIMD